MRECSPVLGLSSWSWWLGCAFWSFQIFGILWGSWKAQCPTRTGLKKPHNFIIQKRHKPRRKLLASPDEHQTAPSMEGPHFSCAPAPPLFPSFPPSFLLFLLLSPSFPFSLPISPHLGMSCLHLLSKLPHLLLIPVPPTLLSPLFGHSALPPGAGGGSSSSVDVAEELRDEASAGRERPRLGGWCWKQTPERALKC